MKTSATCTKRIPQGTGCVEHCGCWRTGGLSCCACGDGYPPPVEQFADDERPTCVHCGAVAVTMLDGEESCDRCYTDKRTVALADRAAFMARREQARTWAHGVIRDCAWTSTTGWVHTHACERLVEVRMLAMERDNLLEALKGARYALQEIERNTYVEDGMSFRHLHALALRGLDALNIPECGNG